MSKVENAPRVRMSPPPLPVLTAINPMIRRMLLSSVGRRIDAVMLLDFTGTRTGRRMRIPVTRHVLDGTPTAITDRAWRLNFTDGRPVVITHRGRTRQGLGTLVPASRLDVGVALRKILDGGQTPRSLGIKVSRGYDPTAADLATLNQSLIQFTFTDE